MKKNKKRTFLRIILVIGILFLVYTFIHIRLYQRVVNKGSALAEERCLVIEPIIQEKQDKVYDYFTDDSLEDGSEKQLEMLNSLSPYYQKTVDVSGPWLKKQKAFLDSWDFNFFTHEALKATWIAQYNKYEADYNSNILMVKYIKDPSEENIQEMTEAIAKQNEMADIVGEKVKIAGERREFIYQFIRVPQSECPDSQYFNHPNSSESVASSIFTKHSARV